MRWLVGIAFALCGLVRAAAWQALGPFGGSALVVDVDRHHPGTVLAATSNAQVFRSLDGGDSWTPLPFPAEMRATLHALIVDPRIPDVYLIALCSDDERYSGILRTSDGGHTWRRLPDPRLKAVWSIAFYPDDPKILVAGTETGVFESWDSGFTWERLTSDQGPEIKPVVSLSFDPADPMILYAGTTHLPWTTTDGGVTWRPADRGMLDDSDVFSILVDRRMRHRLFAATCGGIYRSLDGGSAWSRLKTPDEASYRVFFIAQHPRVPTLLFAGTANGLLRSKDNGATWEKMSRDPTRSIAFDPLQTNRIYLAADNVGLLRSNDLGDSIEFVNRGFSNQNFTWMAIRGGTLYAGVQDLNESRVFERIVESRWQENANPGLAEPVVSFDGAQVPRTSVLYASPDREKLFVKMANSLYLTEDHGETWVLGRISARPPWPPTREVEFLGVVRTDTNRFLAATTYGLFRSDDLGKTWQPQSEPFETGTIQAICKHPERENVLFAAQYGRVYVSDYYGRTWRRFPSESVGAIKSLILLPGTPDRLFALTQSHGVYVMLLTY